MTRLYLHIPEIYELDYRQKILADKDTMSYNAGYDIDYVDYDKETGTINFSEDKWDIWHSKWTNQNDRFFAYLISLDDNIPVGDIAFHFEDKYDTYLCEVLIEANYRNLGYSKEALKLLADVAFNDYKVDKIANTIPVKRDKALNLFKNAGFKKTKEFTEIIFGNEEKVSFLVLDKEHYLNNK